MRLSRRQSLKQFAAAAAMPALALAARRAQPPPIRLVALDVGGTLVQDRGDVPAQLQSALAHHGVASTPAEINKLRGASKREVVRHFVDRQSPPPSVNRDELAGGIYNEFQAAIIEIYRSVPPVAGAEEALRELRRRNYLLATTTGFDRAITMSIIQRLGWEQYFAALISSDDVVLGRPTPYMLFHAMEAARVENVAQVLAIGDTPLDLEAGANAGVRGVVGVLSGAGTAEKLRAEPHTHILASVAELPALLAKF